MIPTAVTIKVAGAPTVILGFVADLGFVLASVAACFALLAIFLRFATTRSSIFDSLSENAYGIYLVHYPYAIWLQYSLLGFAFSAIFRGDCVSAHTLLSWATIFAVARIPSAPPDGSGCSRFGQAPRRPRQNQRFDRSMLLDIGLVSNGLPLFSNNIGDPADQ
jgi:hypothetical protein